MQPAIGVRVPHLDRRPKSRLAFNDDRGLARCRQAFENCVLDVQPSVRELQAARFEIKFGGQGTVLRKQEPASALMTDSQNLASERVGEGQAMAEHPTEFTRLNTELATEATDVRLNWFRQIAEHNLKQSCGSLQELLNVTRRIVGELANQAVGFPRTFYVPGGRNDSKHV
jgi:hypothetical protein